MSEELKAEYIADRRTAFLEHLWGGEIPTECGTAYNPDDEKLFNEIYDKARTFTQEDVERVADIIADNVQFFNGIQGVHKAAKAALEAVGEVE